MNTVFYSRKVWFFLYLVNFSLDSIDLGSHLLNLSTSKDKLSEENALKRNLSGDELSSDNESVNKIPKMDFEDSDYELGFADNASNDNGDYEYEKLIESSNSTKRRRDKNDEKPFVCEYPGCIFAAKFAYQLNAHMKRHFDKKEYACEYPGCNFTAMYPSDLKKHIETVHSEDRRYACEYPGCNYRAKSLGNLTEHMKTHFNEKSYACDYRGCTFTTTRECYLKQHKDTHDAKSYKCDVPGCNFAGNQKRALTRHIATVHAPRENIYKCKECNFETAVESQLEKHFQDQHAPIRQVFECFYCHQLLMRKAGLQNHYKKIHHKQSYPSIMPIYKCRKCDFTAPDKDICLQHYEREHSIEPDPSDLDKSCSQPEADQSSCDFSDTDESTSLQHEMEPRTSTSVYKCNKCDLTFSNERECWIHERKHNIPYYFSSKS